MFKRVALLSITISSLLSANNYMNYGVLTKQAFVKKSGTLSLKGDYIQVNDDVDIFNVKESEIGSLSKYGASLGDMRGYEFEIGYGLSEKDSIFINYQNWNIDYGGADLINSKIEFFNRYNIVANRYAFFNSFSFDIGLESDSANRVDIENSLLIDNMANKVLAEKGVTTLKEYDENGNEISISNRISGVAIDNMSSQDIYLRLLLAKRIFSKTVLNFYSSYHYIEVTSKVNIEPENLIDTGTLPDLDRSEQVFDIGLSWIAEFESFLFELEYEYAKIFREDLDYRDYSHNFEMALSIPLSENFLIFTSGQVMFQQFNRELPYLYNRYTESQFDKKYGFLKLGLIYKIEGL